ncbi:response regulator transcription factor [Brachybacterium sp. ACRRE]|uniref:response regulator transcription factor n=1 Tax=Brachybacterium sp. ACRRE TaxID=2918184 RepID=UPI001EF30AA8|nr:response regulator transcription factor [Brachybacterium sp. ACRRE]MCG7311473.1 response regulator transcription factor [Brachybacterium sp. ACRRE]
MALKPGTSPDARPVRVLLADDEPLVRQGMSLILDAEEDLTVVGEADDGADALRLVRTERPDVVCMDVRMPGIDGIRATELILREPRPPRILVITTFEHDEHVIDALLAGASGLLLKRSGAEEMVQAVRTIAHGESLLFPDSVRTLLKARTGVRPRSAQALTQRETEVLAGLARGLSNAEIADELVVGLETVRSHVAAVLRKLDVRDRTQAAVVAVREGLVDP